MRDARDYSKTLNGHLYGITLQYLSLSFQMAAAPQVSAEELAQLPLQDFPHVVEVITGIMQTGREEDFEFGLDLILDGLQRRLDAGS